MPNQPGSEQCIYLQFDVQYAVFCGAHPEMQPLYPLSHMSSLAFRSYTLVMSPDKTEVRCKEGERGRKEKQTFRPCTVSWYDGAASAIVARVREMSTVRHIFLFFFLISSEMLLESEAVLEMRAKRLLIGRYVSDW